MDGGSNCVAPYLSWVVGLQKNKKKNKRRKKKKKKAGKIGIVSCEHHVQRIYIPVTNKTSLFFDAVYS